MPVRLLAWALFHDVKRLRSAGSHSNMNLLGHALAQGSHTTDEQGCHRSGLGAGVSAMLAGAARIVVSAA